MPGSKEGGQKAAATNKERYGEDFYFHLGRKGGMATTGKPKGFAAMPKEKVMAAGRLGGERSIRKRRENNEW